MDDETGALIERARHGDAVAWQALVDRYSGMLLAVTRAHDLTDADAADVMQTTWLRLVERLPLLREPTRAGGWLAVTARNECLRVLRRKGREGPLPNMGPAVTGPHHAVFGRELAGSLGKAMHTIPERCRDLIELFVTSPTLSYTEIAAALDLPIGSIGPTRARCLTQLRRRLENP